MSSVECILFDFRSKRKVQSTGCSASTGFIKKNVKQLYYNYVLPIYNKNDTTLFRYNWFFLFCRNSSLPVELVDFPNDGAYDVTVSTLFTESELPSRTVFYCELIIPNTPYNVTKRFVYNPGK